MACVGKSWLEKHLISVISNSRKVKENEGRKRNLRNNLENNQYPRYLGRFWRHEYQASKCVFAENQPEKTEGQCTDGGKMDFLIHLTKSIFFMCCDLWLSLGFWSVMNVISLYARPVGEKILYKWLGLLQHAPHSCIQFVNNWTRVFVPWPTSQVNLI